MNTILRCIFVAGILLVTGGADAKSAGNASAAYCSPEEYCASNTAAGGLMDNSKAVEPEPTSAEDFNIRGAVKSEKGDKQGAIADYTRAIELDPLYVPAYMNRAADKLDLGDKPGVIADLSEAARLGNAGAQQWLKENGVSGW